MMHEIFASRLGGKIEIPASKSFVQRFIAAAVLAEGQSKLITPGASDDILTASRVGNQLGAEVRRLINGDLIVTGGMNLSEQPIFCRESGLCARLFVPIAALQGKAFYVDGLPSLSRRHLKFDFLQLEKFGLKCEIQNEGIPARFEGTLKAGEYHLDCSKSSQLLSGLLFAMPLLKQDSIIHADHLVSSPYVDMTLDMMRRFGVVIERREKDTFIIPGNQAYQAQNMHADGDWSAAANLLVAATLIGKGLEIYNLNVDSVQADKRILYVMKHAEIPFFVEQNKLIVEAAKPKGFELDIRDCPDLFPAVLPLACASSSVSKVYHIERLVHKESNRLEAAMREYKKLGAQFVQQKDSLEIHPAPLKYADVNSWGDHRIIMSLVVAAMANKGAMIHDSDHVSKSWPAFFDQLKSIGGKFHAHLR